MLFIIFGILHHRYGLGFLILFQSYFNTLWQSVGELSELAPDVVTAKFAVGRMEHILSEPVRIEATDEKREFPGEWKSLIVSDLSFGYGQSDVLQAVNFSVRRQERIGIIGLSGAGKTTLFKLLMKEHEGYRGSISFDAVPLPTIEKQSYVQHVASVLQETEVFNFTLRENIRIANPTGTEAMLQQALATAHVTDFLHKLPKGLETIIGEKGFRLSGGERQRLGIARAIFKQPQLLLLDEATSHLDVESEKDIQDSLHRFFQSVTAIVIAHRLTTIKEMDRILVIEGGRLIESGSFQELYNLHGRFFDLWEKQQL
jgi:ATP-binding cassette subfamily B protein